MIQIILIFLIIAVLTVGADPVQRLFPKPWAKRLLWTAFIIYVLGNLYFTIFSRASGSGTYVDPRPFGTYLRMSETIEADFTTATGFAAHFLKDISSLTAVILNIFLYYPLGYLLTLLCPRLKIWQVILIGCAASVATELTQYLLRMGWCEMDDVLCNTLGGAIGLWVRHLQNRRLSMRR